MRLPRVVGSPLILGNALLLLALGEAARISANLNVKIRDGPNQAVDGGLRSPNSEETGDRNKIVGGEEVEPHSMPWQVSLVSKRSSRNSCGGVILCPRYVLTAGHCTENQMPRYLQVLVGAHELAKNEESKSRHDILEFHDHPQYHSFDGIYSDFDYSILELKQLIKMRPEARATHLPSLGDDEKFNRDQETRFLVSGWGRLWPHGDIPQKLMSVTVPSIPDDECKESYAEPKGGILFKITPRMICAGDNDLGKIDSCQGDSGGPLVWLDDVTGKVKIIGLVSFGYSCAKPGNPGVYARINEVLSWIVKTTGNCNEETCKKGNCMTKDMLHPDVLQRFAKVTPHRIIVNGTAD